MKTIQSILKMVVVIVALCMTSCSDDEDHFTTASGTDANEEMMREAANNPDEAVFQDVPTVTNYRGFVYVSGNENGTNNIKFYRQDENRALSYHGSVSSG